MARPNPETISNRIPAAIKTTLQTYLNDYLEDMDVGRTEYLAEIEDVSAGKCPAIGIFETGGTVIEKSIRGRDGSGNVLPGYVLWEYGVDLQIFVKGMRREDTLAKMNHWRDAIKACLEDYYDLGGLAVDIECAGDEPTLAFQEKSVWLRSGLVRCTVQAYSMAGATVLAGDTA